ncbi:4,5-DOPA dioxygenase extradiol [Carboxylicivirga taeanensis]|uniref:4,5-DOPA-extradiol-dioxygenase n=1 Tax=Carboxylicivirga taeanensis TaxID=1416875 RepID=UPI003F6DAC9B
MDRNTFIKSFLTTASGLVIGTKLNAMTMMKDFIENTPKMPVLFLGHGSPMNAIEENEFVQGFRSISSEIATPKAIIVISAHWETIGTQVTAMQQPATIHDFGGFPEALYQIQYPAPGMPQLAKEVRNMARSTEVSLDEKWGLDHGAWTVIRHMYPKADIPVIQLSLDYHKTPQQHYELAKELYQLRQKGILIVGSGNLVHNLRLVHWQKLNENFGYDWATEANEKMKSLILKGNHPDLINYSKQGKAFELAIPTPEHYLPLLYTLALQDKKDTVKLFNDEAVAGSLTMTSVHIG